MRTRTRSLRQRLTYWLFGPLLLTEDILSEPLVYKDFELHVPSTPGLGLSLDEERLAFFRRDKTSTAIHQA